VVTRWISETDSGLYDAMYKGIKMAMGDIIRIINPDDFYHRQDVISQIVKAFQQEVTQCVFGDVRFVSLKNLEKIMRYFSSSHFAPHKCKKSLMPAHPTFFT